MYDCKNFHMFGRPQSSLSKPYGRFNALLFMEVTVFHVFKQHPRARIANPMFDAKQAYHGKLQFFTCLAGVSQSSFSKPYVRCRGPQSSLSERSLSKRHVRCQAGFSLGI